METPGTPTEKLWACLDEQADPLIAAYFDTDGYGFAGATFDHLGDNPPFCFTRDDLLALTCLDEHVPPTTLRWFMGDEAQSDLSGLLARIPPDAVIGTKIGDSALDGAAKELWHALQRQPGVGPVKAGKLLARKRPHLVPIVDRVVQRVVQAPAGGYWQLFGEFLASDLAHRRLTDLRAASAPEDVSLLRVLDAAIWMRGSGAEAAYKVRDALIGATAEADLPWAPRPAPSGTSR